MEVFKLYTIKILILFLLTFCGCDWFYNKDEAKKLILQKDPSFSEILQVKEEIDKDIEEIKILLSNKKEMTDTKIKTLKREYANEEKKLSLEIQNLQGQLNKHIEKIERDIQSLSRKLKSKRKILNNIESMIKETDNLLSEDSNMQLTSQERKKWQRKLNDLKLQKKDILEDIESLKEVLHIEKAKIRLLKTK